MGSVLVHLDSGDLGLKSDRALQSTQHKGGIVSGGSTMPPTMSSIVGGSAHCPYSPPFGNISAAFADIFPRQHFKDPPDIAACPRRTRRPFHRLLSHRTRTRTRTQLHCHHDHHAYWTRRHWARKAASSLPPSTSRSRLVLLTDSDNIRTRETIEALAVCLYPKRPKRY